MEHKLLVIFDDSCKSNYDIENIIGDKPFSQIIYKRKTLRERLVEEIKKTGVKHIRLDLDDLYEVEKFCKEITEYENAQIVHFFMDHVASDIEQLKIILQKCMFLQQNILIGQKNDIAAVAFYDARNYVKYIQDSVKNKGTRNAESKNDFELLETEIFYNLNNLSNFLHYMTGGFEARFFNALQGDEHIVTKSSTNKKKIKSEYMFYHLIPDDMKMWFVLPYDYKEDEEKASYTMERLHMPDVAIRWIHGAISTEEFTKLLDKIFKFVNTRKEKEVTSEQFEKLSHALYIDKVKERMEDLKKNQLYDCFNNYVRTSTDYSSIDAIVEDYLSLYESIKFKMDGRKSVIGHGDLCFSNMLYNKDTMTLKLIDTKGALKEDDVWTNPYYDLAKLSHSICGRYDFFNSGLYEIIFDEDMKFNLSIDFDNSEYKKIYREYLEKNGYDYKMIRILEASLFLSMLPLHMDKPQKVFGFILNAINILEEVKNV